MTIIGDPRTYFFSNPHPRLKRGEQMYVTGLPNITEGTEVEVGSYWITSPVHGDIYHVEINGHAVTIPFKYLASNV